MDDDGDVIRSRKKTRDECTMMVVRWKRVATILIVLICALLILNALAVGYAIYGLTRLNSDSLKFESFKLTSLCSEKAVVRFKCKFRRHLFGRRWIVLHFPLPLFISFRIPHISEDRLVRIVVPPFTFAFDEVDFWTQPVMADVNEQYDWQELIDYAIGSGRKEVRMDALVSVRTTAFIIPINIRRRLTRTVRVQPSFHSKTTSQSILSLAWIKYLPEERDGALRIQIAFQLPYLLASSFQVHLPMLQVALLTKDYVGGPAAPLGTISTLRQSITDSNPFLTLMAIFELENKQAIMETLKKVTVKDMTRMFVIRGIKDQKHRCKLQQAFASVKSEFALGDFLEQSRDSFHETHAIDNIMPTQVVEFRLHGQGMNSKHMNLGINIDKKYLKKITGLDVEYVRGRLPQVGLVAKVEGTKGNSTLMQMSITHLQTAAESIEFDAVVSNIDGIALMKCLVEIVRGNQESEEFRQIVFTFPIANNMLNQLLADTSFVYDFALNRHQVISPFVHTNVSTLSEPVDVENNVTANHRVTIEAEQSTTTCNITLEAILSPDPVFDAPAIKISWENIVIEAFLPGQPQQLARVALPASSIHASLTMLHPTYILHKGQIRPQFTLLETNGWNTIIRAFKGHEPFHPILLKGSIGHSPIILKTAIPPIPMLSATAANFGGANGSGLKVKLIGIQGTTAVALIQFPMMSDEIKHNSGWKSHVDVQVRLPPLSTNLCVYERWQQRICIANVKTVDNVIILAMIDNSRISRLNLDVARLQHIDRASFAPEDTKNQVPVHISLINIDQWSSTLDNVNFGISRLAAGFQEGDQAGVLDRLLAEFSREVFGRASLPKMAIEPPKLIPKKKMSLLPNLEPMKLSIDVQSKSAHDMNGSLRLTIPKSCVPPSMKESADFHLEWGSFELTIAFTKADRLRLFVSEGGIVGLSMPNGFQLTPLMNAIHLQVQLETNSLNLTSGQLKMLLHNLIEYRHSKGVEDGNLEDVELRLEAKVGQYMSPAIFKALHSQVPLQVAVDFVQFLFRSIRRESSDHAANTSDWSAEATLDALPQIAPLETLKTKYTQFPCFFKKPCGHLISEPSTMAPLATGRVTVHRLVGQGIAIMVRGIERLATVFTLQAQPSMCQVDIAVHDPLALSATINGNIDILDLTIPPMSLSRSIPIYPVRPSSILDEDRETFSAYLHLPKYYHDIVGYLTPIDFDPFVRVALESPPEPKERFQYSPATISLSTTRTAIPGNLLSAILCTLFKEVPIGPMPSTFASSATGMRLSVTAPIANADLLEVRIIGMSIPNPTTRFTLFIARPIFAEYIYDGRIFGRARIDQPTLLPAKSNSVSIRAQLTRDCFGQCNASSPEVQGAMRTFFTGIALGAPLNVTAVAHLAPGLSLAVPFAHPQRKVQLAVFDVDGSLRAAGQWGVRMVNAIDPVMASGDRFLEWIRRFGANSEGPRSDRNENANATNASYWDRIRPWWPSSAPAHANDTTTTATTTTDSDIQTARTGNWLNWMRDWWTGLWTPNSLSPSVHRHYDTRGHSYFDLNIPLAFRNDADFEMRILGIHLNIAFDDTDGFYFSPKGMIEPGAHTTHDVLIRNTMFLAQKQCQPRNQTDFDRDRFIECVITHPAGPAAILKPRSSLSGKDAVLTPITLSRSFIARTLDEAANHDGPCLRIIDSFLVIGLSSGQANVDDMGGNLSTNASRPHTATTTTTQDRRMDQFTLMIPLNMTEDVGLNPMGDPCGGRTGCIAQNRIDLGEYDDLVVINGQHWLPAHIDVNGSWDISFILHRYSGHPIAFVVQQNGPNIALSDTALFGYHAPHHAGQNGTQPLSKSIAVLFEPRTADDRPYAIRAASNLPYLGWKGAPPNAISILHNGHKDPLRVSVKGREMALKKINGVFAPYEERINVRITYMAGERELRVYCNGERSPLYHSIFPIDLNGMLNEGNKAWIGFTTTRATSHSQVLRRQWRVSDVVVKLVLPKASESRVFWPPGQYHPKVLEIGHFYLQLRDDCDRPIGQAPDDLMVELRRISDEHPRSVIELDDHRPLERTRNVNELLSVPTSVIIKALATYDAESATYDVTYTGHLPGRYAIWCRVGAGRNEQQWQQVRWHTIYIRPHY